MDFLKSQFGRVQQQFGQLNASQKMLSVALMAIMVMTLVWWGHYAGTAEMELLVEQDFSTEEMGRVTAGLRARQIPYQSNGSRIMVPGDRRYEALSDLIYSQQISPKDVTSVFTDI